MRILFASLAALMLLVTGASNADAGARYGKQKVVYHINYPGGAENKAWVGALKNIQNHINAVGKDKLDIKVIIHSNGIYMLKEAKNPGNIQTRMASLRSQNVDFNVCANTIKGKKIGLDQMYEMFEENVVPSGVAELAHLQQQGYTYIKP
jgi:intracellular sulfur oxidation DsrE/DsrF family protein